MVPEIAESVADPPGRVKKAGNDTAHHLLPDEEKEPLAIRYRQRLVIASVPIRHRASEPPWVFADYPPGVILAGSRPIPISDWLVDPTEWPESPSNR
jgi:hypothetical protein